MPTVPLNDAAATTFPSVAVKAHATVPPGATVHSDATDPTQISPHANPQDIPFTSFSKIIYTLSTNNEFGIFLIKKNEQKINAILIIAVVPITIKDNF